MLALKRSEFITMSVRALINRPVLRVNSTNLMDNGGYAAQKMREARSTFLMGEPKLMKPVFMGGASMPFCTNPQQSQPAATPAPPSPPTAAAAQPPPPPPQPQSAGESSAAPPSTSPQAPAMNMPDKQQIEKYFFRTLAFLWDTGVLIYGWSKKNFEKHVVENQTVQLYWKQFLTKLEKARKD